MKKTFFLVLALLVVTLFLGGCTGQSEPQSKEQTQEQPKTEVAAVNVIQTTPPNMLNQLKAKEIDGFIAWEPFNTVAIEGGESKYLFTSSEIWKDHPCCVVALSDNYKDSKTIEAFTWANVKAIQYINDLQNNEKVVQYAAEFTGKDTATVTKALQNITYVEYPAKDKYEDFYNTLEQSKLLTKSVKDIGFADRDKFFAGFLQNSAYETIAANLANDADWVPASVTAETKLRVGFITNDLHQLAIYVAEKEGYLGKVGLTAGKTFETKGFANGVAVMQAFASKDIDMGYLGGAPAILKRINDNIPIELIAGANNEGSGLVVKNDSGINSISDLAGKTIAVPGIGTMQYTLLEKAIKDKGLRLVIK